MNTKWQSLRKTKHYVSNYLYLFIFGSHKIISNSMWINSLFNCNQVIIENTFCRAGEARSLAFWFSNLWPRLSLQSKARLPIAAPLLAIKIPNCIYIWLPGCHVSLSPASMSSSASPFWSWCDFNCSYKCSSSRMRRKTFSSANLCSPASSWNWARQKPSRDL